MRRVPIPLVVILSIGTVAGVWWSETRDMDFMTPRGMEIAMADFSPGVTTPEAPGPQAVVPVDLSKGKPLPNASAPLQELTLDLGDLASAPALSEYTEHADQGAAYLIRLATELEARGEFQRALLCWERVLDSATPSQSERSTASSAVIRIKPTLPRWNVDPMAALRLSLQIGSTRPESTAMTEAVEQLQQFLRNDSGDQVDFSLQITSASSADAPKLGPIALSISSPDGGADGYTLVRSTTPEDNDAESLYQSLLAECYLLVTGHLTTLDEASPPPPPTTPDNAEEDFLQNVTRLHWRLFAQSLVPLSQEPLPYPELDNE